MELKHLTDLIDDLGKVDDGSNSLANLPKTERENYRHALGGTYRLIYTTLNMVVVHPGDILFLEATPSILAEVAQSKINEYLNIHP